MFFFVCCSPYRVCIWAAWSGTGWTCVTCSASVCAALPLWSVDGLNICFLIELLNWPCSCWNASRGLFIALTVRVLAGVCLWHGDGVAPHLQHLPVLRPVGAERPAAVSRLALRGGRHGQLVRQGGVSEVTSHPTAVQLLVFCLCLTRSSWTSGHIVTKLRVIIGGSKTTVATLKSF